MPEEPKSPMEVEVLPSSAMEEAVTQRASLMRAIENRRAARAMAVPTSEEDVRAGLRSFGEPACFYGEDLHDRRERLRTAMASVELQGGAGAPMASAAASAASAASGDQEPSASKVDAGGRAAAEPAPGDEEEEYYVEGSEDLRALRMTLTLPSLERARARLAAEHSLRGLGSRDTAKAAFQQAEADTVEKVRGCAIAASQVGDARPLSTVAFGPRPGAPAGATGEFARDWLVATGSWGGTVKVWADGADARLLQTLDKHSARVSKVQIPVHRPGVLLTSSADGLAYMYVHGEGEDAMTDDKGGFKLKAKFEGHSHRVSDCQMHPLRESLVMTSSFDGTFALHDDGRLLLSQKTGHSEVYGFSIHPDGALVGTCGGEGGIRLWDLRSGRAVMTMAKAHVGSVACLDFSGDGRVLASGGGDNMVKIWDLRGKRCAHGIPAHVSIVSGAKFAGGNGDVLVTGSFDRSVKVWTARRGWALLKAHSGHEDKVTAVDVTPDAQWIVSACYDKTFKIWGPEDAM